MLQGSLPDFTVVDLLRFMASTGKTGVVRFSRGRGGITQSGAIYFRDGQPVAAESEGLAGQEALEILCSWDAGSFAFHVGSTPPEENLDQPFERLLERASEAQEEWQLIWRVLPEPSSIARLATELPPGVDAVSLGRVEWRVVAALRNPQTLSALAEQAGGGLPAYRRLRQLAVDGLLRVDTRD